MRGVMRHRPCIRAGRKVTPQHCCATIWMAIVLPYPGMLPSGPGAALDARPPAARSAGPAFCTRWPGTRRPRRRSPMSCRFLAAWPSPLRSRHASVRGHDDVARLAGAAAFLLQPADALLNIGQLLLRARFTQPLGEGFETGLKAGDEAPGDRGLLGLTPLGIPAREKIDSSAGTSPSCRRRPAIHDFPGL